MATLASTLNAEFTPHAEVLAAHDDRAGSLAAEADRRGIAGAACARAYDSLTSQPP